MVRARHARVARKKADAHLRLDHDRARVLRERAEEASGEMHASGAEEDERDIAESPRAREADHGGGYRVASEGGEGRAKEGRFSGLYGIRDI